MEFVLLDNKIYSFHIIFQMNLRFIRLTLLGEELGGLFHCLFFYKHMDLKLVELTSIDIEYWVSFKIKSSRPIMVTE